VGAVLGAETIFVEVVFSTRCFAVGVTRLVGAVSIEIDYAVALVQNRCFVLADDLVEVYRVALGLAAVE